MDNESGRWDITVKLDLQETGCEGVGRIHLRMLSHWWALVNMVGAFGFHKLRIVSGNGLFNDTVCMTASVI